MWQYGSLPTPVFFSLRKSKPKRRGERPNNEAQADAIFCVGDHPR